MGDLVKLMDVCDINMGQSPDSTSYNSDHRGLPFFQGNADFGEMSPSVRLWCDAPTKIATAGDLLVSVRAPIGAINVANCQCCIGRGLAALTAKVNVCDPSWLYFALVSRVPEMQKQGTGSTFKAINKNGLMNLSLPKCSLNKQREIANRLHTIRSLCKSRQQQLDILDKLAKSRFIELFDFQSHLVPLSHYIDSLQAGKSLAGTQKCKNKVLKTGAVTYDYFDPTQVKYLPVDYVPDSDHKVEDGDVIISRMNTAELVGAAAYVWHAPQNTFLPDRLWKAVVKHNVNPIFLWQLLIQPSIKKTIRNIAGGTSGSMKNISKESLLKIQVPDVDYTLQNEFAAFIEELDKSKLASQQFEVAA